MWATTSVEALLPSGWDGDDICYESVFADDEETTSPWPMKSEPHGNAPDDLSFILVDPSLSKIDASLLGDWDGLLYSPTTVEQELLWSMEIDYHDFARIPGLASDDSVTSESSSSVEDGACQSFQERLESTAKKLAASMERSNASRRILKIEAESLDSSMKSDNIENVLTLIEESSKKVLGYLTGATEPSESMDIENAHSCR